MSLLPGRALTLLLLLAWTAAAQPPVERTVRVRRVPLTGTPVDVRVAPGIPTTLNFDAAIDAQGVALDAPGRVKLLDVGARSITLTPVEALGDAVMLRVRFADVTTSGEPIFSLRTDAAEVDAQVTTYRDARTPEFLVAKVAELEARNATCEAEVTALRERGRATGPAFLVLLGQLDANGVTVDRAVCTPGTGALGMVCDGALRYLARTWVVVAFRVTNPPGQPVWRQGTAWLVSESTGERFAARAVAMAPEGLASKMVGVVAVEFALPPDRAGRAFRVEAREAEGMRHLSISNVKVEQPQKSAPEKDGP